jgi:hypothetical protein
MSSDDVGKGSRKWQHVSDATGVLMHGQARVSMARTVRAMRRSSIAKARARVLVDIRGKVIITAIQCYL